jgi:hypothetical protein
MRRKHALPDSREAALPENSANQFVLSCYLLQDPSNLHQQRCAANNEKDLEDGMATGYSQECLSWFYVFKKLIFLMACFGSYRCLQLINGIGNICVYFETAVTDINFFQCVNRIFRNI